MTDVDQHLTVTLDDDGEPVRAYQTINQARQAVVSDSYSHEDEVDYVPDVPLMEWEPDADALLDELEGDDRDDQDDDGDDEVRKPWRWH